MEIIGYIMINPFYEENKEDIKWMRDFGCQRIVEENLEQRIPHLPKWENLIDDLSCNDTLVISKFSRVLFSLRQLVCLLEFIKLKNIRIISIHDKIDTFGVLFKDVNTLDFINFLCSLGKETWAIYKMMEISNKSTPILEKPLKGKRQLKVVKMYQEKRTISDILKATGYKSKSSIFRILRNFGINPNRREGNRFPKDDTTQ